jgi:hypothetical protein
MLAAPKGRIRNMARGDNRRTPKMRQRKSQAALKRRIARKIAEAKAAK